MLMQILVVLVVVLHLEMEEQKQEELEHLDKEMQAATLQHPHQAAAAEVLVDQVEMVQVLNLVDWEFKYQQHLETQYRHQDLMVAV
jgi:hypothetical protein